MVSYHRGRGKSNTSVKTGVICDPHDGSALHDDENAEVLPAGIHRGHDLPVGVFVGVFQAEGIILHLRGKVRETRRQEFADQVGEGFREDISAGIRGCSVA